MSVQRPWLDSASHAAPVCRPAVVVVAVVAFVVVVVVSLVVYSFYPLGASKVGIQNLSTVGPTLLGVPNAHSHCSR